MLFNIFLYIFLECFEFIIGCLYEFSNFFSVELLFVKEDLQIELIFSFTNFSLDNLRQGSFISCSTCRGDMQLFHNMFFFHEILYLVAKVLIPLITLTLQHLYSFIIRKVIPPIYSWMSLLIELILGWSDDYCIYN